jgi:plasmid stabilization system protein ParE
MRVTYNRKVIAEVKTTARYLDKQNPGLGDRWLDALDAAIERLRRWPESFGFVRGTIRCATMPPFEYGIYYRVLPDRVRVLVIKHHARDPDYGMRRR